MARPTSSLDERRGIAELRARPPAGERASGALRGWSRVRARRWTALGRDDDACSVRLIARRRPRLLRRRRHQGARARRTLIATVNRGCYDTFAAIHDCPVPVIAAVHGFCLGGGIGIVGSCDIVRRLRRRDASACPRSTAARSARRTHSLRMFPIQKVRRMLSPASRSPPPRPTGSARSRRWCRARELRAGARASSRAKIAAKSPRARARSPRSR